MFSEQSEMTTATWTFVETLGIPDSPMRRVLFELAVIAESENEELALAAAAYMALTKAFEEQFTPKSPLQQQLESIRTNKELSDLLGVALPELRGDQFELGETPETPTELGDQLGYRDQGRTVRRILRAKYTGHPAHLSWSPLTEEQVNYVRAHLSPR